MGITDYFDGDSMMWDGEFTFTLDDRTLLRAIQIVEGTEEGWPDYTSGYPNSTIRSQVIDKAGFQIIKQNGHLRTLLKGFLFENIRVADQKRMIAKERQRGFVTRFMRRDVIGNLEADLKGLEVTRDEAFKKYEMLRRLTDWENVLLKRLPA